MFAQIAEQVRGYLAQRKYAHDLQLDLAYWQHPNIRTIPRISGEDVPPTVLEAIGSLAPIGTKTYKQKSPTSMIPYKFTEKVFNVPPHGLVLQTSVLNLRSPKEPPSVYVGMNLAFIRRFLNDDV